MQKGNLKTSQDNIHKLVSESEKYSKETSQFFKHNHNNTHNLPRSESLPNNCLQSSKVQKNKNSINDTPNSIKTNAKQPKNTKSPSHNANQIKSLSKIQNFIELKEKKTLDLINNKHDENENIQDKQNIIKITNIASQKPKNLLKNCNIALNIINKELTTLSNFCLQTIEKNSLQFLNISSNKFKRFPEEIKLFPNLKSLKLDHNFIKTLPNWLASNFKYLEILSVSDNLLQDLSFIDSTDIKNLGNSLRFFDVSYNHIDFLPNNLKYLKELRSLRIHNNDFINIPVSFHYLQNLQEFTLEWLKYLKFDDPLTNDSLFKLLKQRFSIYFQLNYDGFQAMLNEGRASRLYIEVIYQNLKTMEKNDKKVCYLMDLLGFFIEESEFTIDLNSICKDNGYSLMHKAVKNEEIGVMKSLIFYEFENINLIDINQHTALSLAIQEERYFAAKVLIYNNANLEIGGSLMGNCLNLATVKLQIFLIEDLLKFGANPNSKDYEGNSPLHYLSSIFSKDIEKSSRIMTKLLEYGAEPNIKNQDFWSPIHLAVKRDQIQALLYMISYNKSLKTQAKDHYIGLNENKTIEKSKKNYIYKPFKINKRGGIDKWTALHIAVSITNYDILKVLLDNKADIYATNINNYKPVVYCRSGGVLKLLRVYERRILNYIKHQGNEGTRKSFMNITKEDKNSDIDEDRSRIMDTFYDVEEEKIVKNLILGSNDINKIEKFNKLMSGIQKPSIAMIETNNFPNKILRSKSSIELTNINKIYGFLQAFHQQYKNLQFSLIKYQKLIIEGFSHYSLSELLRYVTSIKLLYYRLVDEIKILEGNSINFETLQKLLYHRNDLKDSFQAFKESYYYIPRCFVGIVSDLLKKYKAEFIQNKEKMKKGVILIENILIFLSKEKKKGISDEFFMLFLKEINDKMKDIYILLSDVGVFLRYELISTVGLINGEKLKGKGATRDVNVVPPMIKANIMMQINSKNIVISFKNR